MITLYLVCFVTGLTLSLLAAFTGLGHLHLGHLQLGHPPIAPAHSAHAPTGPAYGGHAPALNGFTLPAFLCWFGGVGYLLARSSTLVSVLILAAAIACGLAGAAVVYTLLFRVLAPRERLLLPEETRMEGVVGQVSAAIRPAGGTGEILFTQLATRRHAAARSQDGAPIARGTEVVVLRYTAGIAYVSPLAGHDSLAS